jgi:hypothetical protein
MGLQIFLYVRHVLEGLALVVRPGNETQEVRIKVGGQERAGLIVGNHRLYSAMSFDCPPNDGHGVHF